MDKNSKIYIAGATGMVGSAIQRKLILEGYSNIVTISSKDLDLRNQQAVNMFFGIVRPEYVFMAAGLVGGIVANNTRRGEFIYDNTMMQTNVIHASYLHQTKKLLLLGSSCIYPRYNEQPIKETSLLSGELEPTNEPYAIAKIAALKMGEAYNRQYDCQIVAAMPTNLFGVGDNYDEMGSHVIPALLRKFILAKRDNTDVIIWGTGTPRREFLYVDDLADACLFLMDNYNDRQHINVGNGVDIELNELVQVIAELTYFTGKIIHDESKPDGMKRKLLSVEKINNLGWFAKTDLKSGLLKTISDIYKKGIDKKW